MLKQNRRGFTIVEVAVIIILMGFIGIIAVPSVGLIRRQEVKKLAKEICLDLTAQRTKAMTMGRVQHSVELTDDAALGYYNGYKLSPAIHTAGGTQRDKNEANSKNIRITMETTDGEADVIAVPTKIQFDGYGYMMDTGVPSKDIYELKIVITYDTAKADIFFDGITGHYKITY
ncbi:MAG: hypothetical protein K0S71_1442 [Clostridia bacterium]|jgi:Tfp pilus assembly protein FimT|nr:hypothetical protein [Clostridia bacterium]